MKPLYDMLGGSDHEQESFLRMLTPGSKSAIELWCVLLLISEYDKIEGKLPGRAIQSFVFRQDKYLVEFDGSIYGVGWRIFDQIVDRNRPSTASGYAILATSFFPEVTSTYQNTVELSALVLALLQGAIRGWRDCSIVIRGDSMTVLYWASTSHFRSTIAVAASICLLAICEYFHFHLSDNIQFLTSEENVICDALSRGKIDQAILLDPETAAVVNPMTLPLLDEMLACCTPTLALDSSEDFLRHWYTVREILSRV